MRAVVLSFGLLAFPLAQAQGQELLWSGLSNEGVRRASATVDSVFVDRLASDRFVDGGDWVSYLAARLGVVPLPDMSGIHVAVDSARILISGRLGDLPQETRVLFGAMATLLDSSTTMQAEIILGASQAGLARFILRTISINGFPIPETILGPFLTRVGTQYPVLTSSGRVLLVQTPMEGVIRLTRSGVQLSMTEVVIDTLSRNPRGG